MPLAHTSNQLSLARPAYPATRFHLVHPPHLCNQCLWSPPPHALPRYTGASPSPARRAGARPPARPNSSSGPSARHSARSTHAPQDVPRPAGAGPTRSRGHGDGGPGSEGCSRQRARPPPQFKGRKAPGGPCEGCLKRCLREAQARPQPIPSRLRPDRPNTPELPRGHKPQSALGFQGPPPGVQKVSPKQGPAGRQRLGAALHAGNCSLDGALGARERCILGFRVPKYSMLGVEVFPGVPCGMLGIVVF